MFPARYFAPRYFASRYFTGPSLVQTLGGYFPSGAFAPHYFAGHYFPHRHRVPSTNKPGYFLHSVFARVYFADRYFPGHVPTLVPPPPPIEPTQEIGGGLRRPLRPLVIHGRVDLLLSTPELQAFGLLDTAIRGAIYGWLPGLRLRMVGQVVHPRGADFPLLVLSAEGTHRRPPANGISAEDQQALEEYYAHLMATITEEE